MSYTFITEECRRNAKTYALKSSSSDMAGYLSSILSITLYSSPMRYFATILLFCHMVVVLSLAVQYDNNTEPVLWLVALAG